MKTAKSKPMILGELLRGKKKRGRPRGRPKGSKNKKREPIIKISTTKKMSNENGEGIYTSGSEDSFESLRDIRMKSLEKGNVSINYPDRYINELSFEELNDEMIRRSQLRQKVENREYYTTIEIHTERPFAIGWYADIHASGQDVDHELIKWEADEIKRNPFMGLFLGGDLADSFCWNPAQFGDVANLNEQDLYLHKLLEYIGYDKILAGVVGNHERWARRGGIDMYHDIRKKIPLFDGVGTVVLKINDIPYIGAMMHKSKGFSYINPNHGQGRFSRENEGYDFILSAHNHTGAEQSQMKNSVGGMRKVVFLAGKTFKRGDDFLGGEGNPRLSGEGLGTNWILFNHKQKMMIPLSSTAEVLEVMGAI